MKILDLLIEYIDIKDNDSAEKIAVQIFEEMRNVNENNMFNHGDDIDFSEVKMTLELIKTYKLLQKVAYEFSDTFTDNNFGNGYINYYRQGNASFLDGLRGETTETKILTRLAVYRFMAFLSLYSIEGFCYPCILLKDYHKDNQIMINKSVSESFGEGYGIFYDSKMNNYNYINLISLNDRNDIINESIYKMIDEENSRRIKNNSQIIEKDKMTLIINVTNIEKVDFETVILYSNLYRHCRMSLHGDIKFDNMHIELNHI